MKGEQEKKELEKMNFNIGTYNCPRGLLAVRARPIPSAHGSTQEITIECIREEICPDCPFRADN